MVQEDTYKEMEKSLIEYTKGICEKYSFDLSAEDIEEEAYFETRRREIK